MAATSASRRHCVAALYASQSQRTLQNSVGGKSIALSFVILHCYGAQSLMLDCRRMSRLICLALCLSLLSKWLCEMIF